MPAKKSKKQKLLVKDNSGFLLAALLLVAILFLMIAFGPFKADKLGLLSKKQQTQQSEAANMLPPDGGSGGRRGPCWFLPKNTATGYPYGDVNKDGRVTSVDAQIVLKEVVRAPLASPLPGDIRTFGGYPIEVGDVNDTEIVLSKIKDSSYKGDIDSVDALLILKYVAGEINTFPACFGRTNTIPLP